MRILIAAPRKSGNTRLRCLLASIYGLNAVGSRGSSAAEDMVALETWLTDGQFPDGSVTHRGFTFSPSLSAVAARNDVALTAILRHPLDLFLSNFDIAQQRGEKEDPESEAVPRQAWQALAGKSIEDPAVYAYLADDFGAELAWLRSWHDSGQPVVRLEWLTSEPAAALTGLAARIGPCSPEQIASAIAVCPATNIVYSRPDRRRRMPELQPGAWRERLTDAHLALFRDRYGAAIEAVGYEIA